MTSYYGVQTQSEVFAELERIAQKEGFVKNAADENSDQSSKGKYNVTGGKGEDEVNAAHPGGGSDCCEAQGDYGKVETLLEQHKVFEEVAGKNPTGKLAYVVNFLQKVATVIEEEGLQSKDPAAFKVGKVLDEAVEKLIVLAKKKKKDEDDEDKDDKKKDKKKKKGKGKKKELPEALKKAIEKKKKGKKDKKEAAEEVAFTVKL